MVSPGPVDLVMSRGAFRMKTEKGKLRKWTSPFPDLLEPRHSVRRGDVVDCQLTVEADVLSPGEAVVTRLARDDLGGSHSLPGHRLDLDGVSDHPVLVLNDAGVGAVILQPVVLYDELAALGDPHHAQPALPVPLSEGQAVLAPADVCTRTSVMQIG